MKAKNDIVKSCFIAGGISVILAVLLFFLTPTNERTIVNIVSICGGCFSLAGVVIAIIQIAKIRSTSEAASIAATEAKDDLRKLLSITEFAQIVSIIRKVETFVREDKFDMAIERIIDIKDFLDRVSFLKVPNVDGNAISRCKNKIDMNMYDLEKSRIRSGSLNKESFIKDMEDLVSLLNKTDNQIKSL